MLDHSQVKSLARTPQWAAHSLPVARLATEEYAVGTGRMFSDAGIGHRANCIAAVCPRRLSQSQGKESHAMKSIRNSRIIPAMALAGLVLWGCSRQEPTTTPAAEQPTTTPAPSATESGATNQSPSTSAPETPAPSASNQPPSSTSGPADTNQPPSSTAPAATGQ